MPTAKTRLGTAVVGVVAAGSLLAGVQPAHADLAPQEKDVVAAGSDIQQNSFNFLADGYHELPGYNTAGNKWRFINFNSSGDDNGRSAYLSGTTTVFNPTIQLRAGHDNVTRPSGGGGGLWALANNDPDTGALIDVSRSPNRASNDQKSAAASSGTGTLKEVQVARDRDFIAVADDSYIPANLSGADVVDIYKGLKTKLSDLSSWTGSAAEQNGVDGNLPLTPLYLPSSAGMQKVFRDELTRLNGGTAVTVPGSIPQVQQNDPTVITGLSDADKRRTALVPFPKGRFFLLSQGYYADGPYKTGTYGPPSGSTVQNFGRTALDEDGIKLLADNTTGQQAPSSTFGVDFYYHAIFRQSDYDSDVPWQPGSTQNWVEALFYQPDPEGPKPFVDTPAGKALLQAAGVVPDYHAY